MLLDQHRVPRGVIGNDIDEHLHAACVRSGHQRFQIFGLAIRRIDRIVVAHRVRTAERSLRLELAHGVNGHQPDDIDTEIFQPVQLCRDAFEIPARGERAWKHLVDDCRTQPIRTRTSCGSDIDIRGVRGRTDCDRKKREQRGPYAGTCAMKHSRSPFSFKLIVGRQQRTAAA